MRRRTLIISALCGLTCGLAVRLCLPFPGPAGDLPVPDQLPPVAPPPPAAASSGTWDSRIAAYLEPETQPPPLTGSSPRGDALALRRMSWRPVGELTLRESIAVINATGTARFSPFLPAVFEKWVRENPAGALAAAQQLRDPVARMALVWKSFAAAAAAGDADILAKATAQPRGLARTAALAALTESVRVDRIAEVLQQSMTGPPPHHVAVDSFQEQLLRKAAKSDPKAPLHLALETGDPAWRAGLLQGALLIPDGADRIESSATFAKLARDSRNVDGLMYHMGLKLQHHAGEAIPLMEHWPQSNRLALLRGAFSQAFRQPDAEATRSRISPENLEALVRYTETQFGAGPFRSLLAEAALVRGVQGLHDTAQWLANRQDSAAAGLDDLTRRTTRSEPFTTARWLATLPPSPERDRAVAAFAETHAATDPGRAIAWARSIADPGQRAATLGAVEKTVSP